MEVQLKTLAANAMQREREIAELKRSALKDSSKVSSLLFLPDWLPINSAKRYACSLYFGCSSVLEHCRIDIVCSAANQKKHQILLPFFRNRISVSARVSKFLVVQINGRQFDAFDPKVSLDVCNFFP